jgi:hypothetical protein
MLRELVNQNHGMRRVEGAMLGPVRKSRARNIRKEPW